MNGPWFIETLARNGDVLHRHLVAALPIRIGRGYDNDYIVDDAYAAPRHAIVDADGEGRLVLRDLGSRNGVVHKGKRRDSIVLDGDTVVRMGHTSLRVRPANYPVPPELADRTRHGWEGVAPGLAGLVLVGLVSLLMRWLSDTQAFEFVRYLQALAYGLGIGLLWAGMWGLGTRLFGRQARLGRHLFIFGSGLMVLTASQLAAGTVGYAFSLGTLTRFSSQVAIVVLAGMVWHHLVTVRPQNRRRYALICVALAALGSGLTMVGNVVRNGRGADELYMAVLLPPAVRMSPDRSVDEFMAQVQAMQPQLEAERRRKAAADPARDG